MGYFRGAARAHLVLRVNDSTMKQGTGRHHIQLGGANKSSAAPLKHSCHCDADIVITHKISSFTNCDNTLAEQHNQTQDIENHHSSVHDLCLRGPYSKLKL